VMELVYGCTYVYYEAVTNAPQRPLEVCQEIGATYDFRNALVYVTINIQIGFVALLPTKTSVGPFKIQASLKISLNPLEYP
jgi:hypothetical protein